MDFNVSEECGKSKDRDFVGKGFRGQSAKELRDILWNNYLDYKGDRLTLCQRIYDNHILDQVPGYENIYRSSAKIPKPIAKPIAKVTTPSTKKWDFDDIKCGFKLNQKYKIVDLICANIGNTTASELFEEKRTCTSIGEKISQNLVRVASKRIFDNPLRSFIEPVANGIDSYREKSGAVGNIGKFGMGFFSLFYWLKDPKDILTITSTYKIGGKSCEWMGTISTDGKDLYFRLNSSKYTNSKKLGTKIRLRSESFVNFSSHHVEELLKPTFYFVKDVDIIFNGLLISAPSNRSYYYNVVSIEFGFNNFDTLMVTDDALGMSLNTFFTKLLVPSISTKTISKSISNKTTVDDPISFSKVVQQVDPMPGLFLVVGDITIYRSEFEIDDEYMYVWKLPARTPLPVSRDDVILEDPPVYDVAKKSLIHLIDDVVRNKRSIDLLFKYLKGYVDYSNTTNAYKLYSDAQQYVFNNPNIILINKGYSSFYINLTKVSSKNVNTVFAESDVVNLDKLEKYILSRGFDVRKSIFKNKNIIVLENVEENTGNVYSTGGTNNILFVDELFVHNNSDWVEKLTRVSKITLITDNTVSQKVAKNIHDEVRKLLQWNQHYLYDTVLVPGIDKFINLITDFRLKESLYIDNVLEYILNLIIQTHYIVRENNYILLETVYSSLYKFLDRERCYTNQPQTIAFMVGLSNQFGHKYGIGYGSKIYVYIEQSQEYVLAYFNLFYGIIQEYKINMVQIINPLDYSIYAIESSDLTKLLYNKLRKEPIIYSFFVVLTILKLQKDGIDIQPSGSEDIINFLIGELYKNSLLDLNSIFINYVLENMNQELSLIIEGLSNAVELFMNTLKNRTYGVPRAIPPKNVTNYNFTVNQLIQYVYNHDVDNTKLTWLKDVSNVKLDDQIKFQALEIAVNEGTTKSYINSVLTETIQNVIDASRGKIDLNKSSLMSSNDINVRLGKDKDQYIIAIMDNIGITMQSIIAIMIPFYSTKSEGDINTGEIGSGFMNLYRQPYTKQVVISTVDPNTKIKYFITGSPIIEKGRVVDISYNFLIDPKNKTPHKQGTDIYIYLNSQSPKDISALYIEGSIFVQKYAPYLPLNFFLNCEEVEPVNTELVLESKLGKAYIVRDITTESIILTNGVPFGELHPIIKKLFGKDDEAIITHSGYNIIVDLSKDIYQPVQSRKKIILEKSIEKELILFLRKVTVIYNIISKVLKSDDQSTNDYLFPGISYEGEARQVIPSRSYDFLDEPVLTKSDTPATLGNVIRDIIQDESCCYDDNGGFDSDLIEKKMKSAYQINSEYMVDLVKIWFSNKTNIKTTVTAGNVDITDDAVEITEKDKHKLGDKSEGEEKLVVPKLIADFVNDMVVQSWKWIYDNNINPNPVAPEVVLDQYINGAIGLYNTEKHEIIIDPRNLDLKGIYHAIAKYIEIFNRNKEEAVQFLKQNPTLNNFVGIQNSAVTVVHEFGHAVKNNTHTDQNAHSNFSYTIGKTVFNYTFDKGCNELWVKSLIDYEPTIKHDSISPYGDFITYWDNGNIKSKGTKSPDGKYEGHLVEYTENGQGYFTYRYDNEGVLIDTFFYDSLSLEEYMLIDNYDSEGHLVIVEGMGYFTYVGDEDRDVEEGYIRYSTGRRELRWDTYEGDTNILIRTCDFVDGVINGVCKSYYDNGDIRDIQEFVNGQTNGKYEIFSKSGILIEQGTEKDDQRNGKIYYYYPDTGKIKDIVTFANGVKNGWAEYFNEDGIKYMEGTLKDGSMEGEWNVYDDKTGIFVGVGTYSNNQKNGIWQSIYPNGNVESEGRYLDGKKVGIWEYWYPDGF